MDTRPEPPAARPFPKAGAYRQKEAMNKTRIVLADDHPVVRHGVRSLLQSDADFAVIGEASDGIETVPDGGEAAARRAGGRPDDPRPERAGNYAPGAAALTETRVIILSMHANEPYVLEALKNGASGYVLEDSSGTDLIQAVRAGALGQRYLSPPLSERAVEAYMMKSQETTF